MTTLDSKKVIFDPFLKDKHCITLKYCNSIEVSVLVLVTAV